MLTNLRGDVVAEGMTTAASPTWTAAFDEFGAQIAGGSGHESGWFGGVGLLTGGDPGVMQMGHRTYLASIGRFLQIDSIPGGAANDYDYVNQDPLNQADLDGQISGPVNPCGSKSCSQVNSDNCKRRGCGGKGTVWKTLQVGCGVYGAPKGAKGATKRVLKVISRRIPEYDVPVVGEVCASVALITIWSKIF